MVSENTYRNPATYKTTKIYRILVFAAFQKRVPNSDDTSCILYRKMVGRNVITNNTVFNTFLLKETKSSIKISLVTTQ